MNCKISSLYICVRDMDRAIAFYERLFDMPVTEKDEIYSVFEICGFRFGLFAFEKKGEAHEFGSSCLPSVCFESVDLLRSKLEGKQICFELKRIKSNWVAEIIDSEGNHIEMTAPDK